MSNSDVTEELVECLYAVRNSEGKYFHRIGYGGYGSTWVDGITTARIYPKIGPARARITYFATHYPDFPVPELVKLVITRVEVVDEAARVSKVIKSKARRIARNEAWWAEENLKESKRSFEAAQKRYQALLELTQIHYRGRSNAR